MLSRLSFYDVLAEQEFAMRFWFDLLTPKQVLFFRPVIDGLRKDGDEVLATSRRYREVEQLASLLGLDLTFAGTRGGKDPLGQFQIEP